MKNFLILFAISIFQLSLFSQTCDQFGAYQGIASGTNTYSVTIGAVTCTQLNKVPALYIKNGNTNTGASTLQLNSFPALPITLNGSALSGAEFISGVYVGFKYDLASNSWQMQKGSAAIGTTGRTGSTGATGSAGSNGINGSTGSTGATGSAGSNGTDGSTGSTGSIGATGSGDGITVITSQAYQVICSGNADFITLTSNVGGTTFAWGTPVQEGVTGASSGSGSTISQPLTATGTADGIVNYSVVGTSPSGFTYVTPVIIIVHPAPIVTSTPNVQTITDGQTTSLALSSNLLFTTFSWSVIQVGLSGTGAGSGDTIAQTLTLTASPTPGTAIYHITPTSQVNGCSGTAIDVTVTVNP